jgi:hypothetical protein
MHKLFQKPMLLVENTTFSTGCCTLQSKGPKRRAAALSKQEECILSKNGILGKPNEKLG